MPMFPIGDVELGVRVIQHRTGPTRIEEGAIPSTLSDSLCGSRGRRSFDRRGARRRDNQRHRDNQMWTLEVLRKQARPGA